MLPILNIGPLALQTPLLILLVGVWLSISLVEKEAEKSGLDASVYSNLALIFLGGVVVGGRLVYVFQHLNRYLDAPLGIILPNPGTIAVMEGFVLAVVAGVIYIQRKDLPWWKTLDAAIPSAALVMLASAGMHLAGGEAYGMPSAAPWAIELRGAMRHPVQVYEILLYGLILALLVWQRFDGHNGVRFFAGVSMMAAARLIAEGFRADALALVGWRAAQLAAFIILIGSLLLLRWRVFAAEEGA